VVVYPHEIEHLRPADWRDVQNCLSMVESRQTGCLPTGHANGDCSRSSQGECHHVALYARVSSVDQKNDLERQLERLKDYAAAHGYQVTRMVSEIGSGLNDRRQSF
jgi:hypothetical protein